MLRADAEADRRGNPLGAWLLLLIASPALLFFGERGEPARVQAEETAVASRPRVEESDACLRRFLASLEDLAYQSRSEGAGATLPQNERNDLRTKLEHLLAALRPTTDFDAFVATVADPIDSGLGYQFDTSLKALRSAFEEGVPNDGGRFYRDRSWLPWDDRGLDGEQHQASQECRRELPGLVLFRGGRHDRPRLRALLLVGETPTAGVHRNAFVRALEIATIFGGSGGALGGRIGVVGPTFSGSAHSMRLASDHWASLDSSLGSKGIRVATGTATGSGLRTTLEVGTSSDPNWFGRGMMEFQSTTPSEADLQCRYLKFLYWRRFASIRAPSEGVLNVALLHEGGTEFGAALQRDVQPQSNHASAQPADAGSCTSNKIALRPALDLSFPVHIGRLRDAYEDMDRNSLRASGAEPVGRRTSLEISLREKRAALEFDAEPSPKTTYAGDIALTHLLGTISRSSVDHVAIQATDVGDAIFLARKIRDVAPDVRIAFFSADVLLLHPSFYRDLRGSLVVNAYPFFGTNDFSNPEHDAEPRDYRAFESSASEGVYNAALSLRGAQPSELSDYTFAAGRSILPVWVSAIGNDKLVPISVRESRSPVYASVKHEAALRSAAASSWRGHSGAKLLLAGDVRLPRFWHFLFASLLLGFCVDQLHQRRAERSFSGVSMKSLPNAACTGDLAVVKTKWELYAAIRTFVPAMAISYMAYVYALTLDLYADNGAVRTATIAGAIVAAVCAVVVALFKTCAFAVGYIALGRAVGKRSLLILLAACWNLLRRGASHDRGKAAPVRTALDSWDRFTLPIGLARPENVSAAALSFCQLRALANLALALSLFFVGVEVYVLLKDADGSDVSQTLVVFRNLTLVGGVSPAAPMLLCLGLTYVWAFGRMERLALSHGLSRLTPPGGMEQEVSTPIRHILYPNHESSLHADESLARADECPTSESSYPADESFGHIERHVVNSIVRPITGPQFCVAVGILAILPATLFWLKPVTTLEQPLLTLLLMSGLGLCTFLIVNTLVQLVQYWLALKLLLKRILEHRLGRSFERVARFVRDSLEDQISRTPHDVLRLGACASRFDDLVRLGGQIDADGGATFASDARERLEARRKEIERLRCRAIAADATTMKTAVEKEAKLGREVIEGARELMGLLVDAWDGRLPNKASMSLGPMSSMGPRPPAAGVERKQEWNDGKTDARESIHELPRPPALATQGSASPTLPTPHRHTELRSPPSMSEGPASTTWQGAAASLSVPTTEQGPDVQVVAPTSPLTPRAPRLRSNGTRSPQAVATEHEWSPDPLNDALRAEGWRYTVSQLAWLREAESLVATIVALLLSRHVRQFHVFVQTLTLCALVLLLAVLSYPFEPHRLLLTFVMGVVVSVVVVGFWIYLEFDRSTLLSHIAGSVPGKLTFDAALVRRVLAWGFIPLLVLAAAQYPDVANALLRVADPILRALR